MVRRVSSRRRNSAPALFLLLAALLCGSPAALRGSGFSILELSAKANGMGTAFTGVASDLSTLYWNPAGIAFFPGTQMEMDAVIVMGSFQVFPTGAPVGTIVPPGGFSGQINLRMQPVGNFFFTHQFSPKVTFGFGAFMPFGLSGNFTNFKDSDPANIKYVGRFAGTRDLMQEIWFQPTLAFRMTPNSSFAVGPALVHTHVLLEQSFLNPVGDGLSFGQAAASQIFPGVDPAQAARSIARLLPEGRGRIAGVSDRPGLSVSYLYKHPSGRFNFGLMWRSAVANHFKGTFSFGFTDNATIEQFIGKDFFLQAFPNQKIKFNLTTPATYSVGFAFGIFAHSTLALDLRAQDYRRFKDVPVDFSITSANNPKAVTPPERRLPFNFRDSYNIAVGWEKPLTPNTVFRAGYLYDRTPVVASAVGPLFPDSNRHKATVGLTRIMGNKEITLFYDYTKFMNRNINVPANADLFTNGLYQNHAHLFGLSVRMITGGPH